MANCQKPIPFGGIMVAPVHIPAFTVQVKNLDPSGTLQDLKYLTAEQRACMEAQELEKKQRAEEEKNAKLKNKNKEKFLPPRPDLWKCVNNNSNTTKEPASKPKNDCHANAKPRAGSPKATRPRSRKGNKSREKVCNESEAFISRGRTMNSADGDNMSIATTDTQKLLAMLKESEGEIEGLSVSSSMKGSSEKSSSGGSVFEPAKAGRHANYLKVVQKKPSPEPVSRLEKKWANTEEQHPQPKQSKNTQKPQSAIGVPSIMPSANIDTEPSENWWNKSDGNFRDRQNARDGQGTGKQGCGHQGNLDLPAVAHLGQLGIMRVEDSNELSGLVAGNSSYQQQNQQMKPWSTRDTKQYFAKDTTKSGKHSTKKSNNKSAFDSRKPKHADSTCSLASVRSAKSSLRRSKSRNRPQKTVSIGSTISWGGRNEINDNVISGDHAKTDNKFVTNVFTRDMTNTKNMCNTRGPKMQVISKVPADPATIKRTPGSSDPASHCAPTSMEAAELMALEEDINDMEQQEDTKRLARYMSADLKDQLFTDVTIQCKDQIYKIHKEFLLAFTTYDIPVISGEPLREMPALNLTDVDSSDLATVLHFLYYGELKVNIYNILGVQAAASALGVVDIPPILEEFHEKLFSPANLTNIIDFAQFKDIQPLSDFAWALFISSFYDHINGSHFLNWEVKWVLHLLGHEDLPIKSELEVFEAARLWLNHRPDERSDYVKAVLSNVRWTYMSAEELVECEREDPCLMNRTEAHELIADANWHKVMMRNGVPWSDFNIALPRGNPNNQRPVAKQRQKPPKTKNKAPGAIAPTEKSFPAGSGDITKFHSSLRSNCDKGREFRDAETAPLDVDAFSETSFNSLDVDLSHLSCGDEDRNSYGH